MTSQSKWICDGVPKNNDQQYNTSGPHPACENEGLFCNVCGLPPEAMLKKTIVSNPDPNQNTGNKTQGKLPILVVSLRILFLLALGGGAFWYLTKGNKPDITNNGNDTDSFPQFFCHLI